MKKIVFLVLFIVISLIFLNSSCKDEIAGTNIDNIVIPDSNVSYNQHIQPIFEYKCNYSGCHDDASRSGGLSLTSYQKVTANYSIVFPGNPESSRLVLSIEGRSAYPMPPVGYRPLTLNQIKGIRTWVKEGAKNN